MRKYLCIPLLFLFVFGCSSHSSGSDAPEAADTTASGPQNEEKPAITSLTYEQKQGKQIYLKFCSVCHGDQGGGDGFNAYNLDPKPHSLADSAYVTALSDETLKQVISLGGRGVNKSVLMPAYQYTLNRSQINYLIRFIRSLNRPAGTMH